MARTLLKGCVAIAEAAIRGGCRFFSGYPITPQNEIPEHMAARMPEVGGVFVQGESEVASVNMVYGAASTGTRSMTSSSSCGMSLKSEGISYMAGADVPAFLCSVQRGGPGVGVIQPAQQDYFQATKAHGNGGFRMLVYAPIDVQEAVDFTYMSFEKAEKYRKPVMLLTDGITGALMEPVELPPMRSDEELTEAKRKCQDAWALRGKSGGERHRIDSGHRPYQEQHNIQDWEIYKTWERDEVLWEEYLLDDAELVITAYGISARMALTAIEALRAEGYRVGLLRPRTLYPFPKEAYRRLDYSRVRAILSVEMSIPPQFAEDVAFAVMGKCPVETCLRSGGEIMKWEDIVSAAKKLCEGGRA